MARVGDEENITETSESPSFWNQHVDKTANSLLLSTAPETTRRLKGILSLTFIIWYGVASCVSFALLFWQFYTQNCSFRSEIIPNLSDFSRYDSYGNGRNYLCNSKIAMEINVAESWFSADNSQSLPGTTNQKITFYCLLGNFKPDDYGNFRYVINDILVIVNSTFAFMVKNTCIGRISVNPLRPTFRQNSHWGPDFSIVTTQ